MANYHPQLELFRAKRDLANLFDNLILLDYSGVSDNEDKQQQQQQQQRQKQLQQQQRQQEQQQQRQQQQRQQQIQQDHEQWEQQLLQQLQLLQEIKRRQEEEEQEQQQQQKQQQHVTLGTEQQRKQQQQQQRQQQQQQQRGVSAKPQTQKNDILLSSLFGSFWSPAVDLSETDNCYKVVAELPGMGKNDINIYFEDDTLVISGEKHAKAEKARPPSSSSSTSSSSSSQQTAASSSSSSDEKKEQQQQQRRQQQNEEEEHSHWSEISYGKFERRIALPRGVQHDKIKASFEDGVLRVQVPKPETTIGQRKQIAIE